MEASDKVNELVTALAKAQGIIAGAKKDTENKFLKSKYADLASVWEVARKPLSDNGLSVIQSPENYEHGIRLTTRLYHTSGQCISSVLEIPVTKKEPQVYGTTISYARRYAFAAMIGIYSEDDDGQAAGLDKKNIKKLLQPDPKKQPEKAGEWLTKLKNIKKDPGYKAAIKAIAKEKKFIDGTGEADSQFNFELITSYEPQKSEPNTDESGKEYF